MKTPEKVLRSMWLPFVAAVLFGSTATFPITAQEYGPTLAPAGSAAKAVSAKGFIQRWFILEPIHSSGLTESAVRAALKIECFPDPLVVLPKAGDSVTCNGTNLSWHAVDSTNYNVNLFHFARALRRPTSDVLFQAVTLLECPEDRADVRLAIGSNAASVWWVNGREVIGIYGDRQTVIDDGVSKRIALRKGTNVIRCVVMNAGGATDFCARFLNEDGKPLTDLSVNLNGVR